MSSTPEQPTPSINLSPPGDAVRAPFLRRSALYPAHYTWYVFFSSLDLLFTWLILHAGGSEENSLAAWIIRRHDLPGVVAFKFALVIAVVLICELVGRRRYETGAKLARWAVVLSAFPVVVGAAHVLCVALGAGGF